MEYVRVVWHSSLTNKQTRQLESIQRKAIKLIFGNDSEHVGLQSAMDDRLSLVERRDELTKQFYDSLLQPSSC